MRRLTLLMLLAACKTPVAPLPTDDTDAPATDTDDTDPPTFVPPTPQPLGDPEDEGPQSWTLRLEELDVGQELPVRMRIHEPANPDTRVALILTGFSLAPDLYDSYAQHLASHGYVAIGVGLRTNAFTARTQLSLAQDVSSVIDWVDSQGGAMANVDTSRTVIAGHSLGGKLALLTALEDSRVYGVFGIDPVDANPPGQDPTPENPSLAPERMGEIDFPLVLVGEDLDQDVCAPQGDNYRDYYDATTSPVVRVEVEDANHVSFLDNPDCGFLCNVCTPREDDPVVTRAITRGLMLAYFEHILLEREGARDWLLQVPGRDDEVNINVKNGF